MNDTLLHLTNLSHDAGVSQPGTWQELTLSEKAAAAFLTLQALDSTRAGLQFLAYAEGLREAELQLQLAEEAAPAQFFTEGQIEGGFRGVWLELQEDQRGDLTTDATLQQVQHAIEVYNIHRHMAALYMSY